MSGLLGSLDLLGLHPLPLLAEFPPSLLGLALGHGLAQQLRQLLRHFRSPSAFGPPSRSAELTRAATGFPYRAPTTRAP